MPTTPHRHSALIRITHWLTFLAFIALLITGAEIIVSHPRFYWGETGNVNMHPLFTIPIPASRPTVPTHFHFVMPDQNGWSRYLHFQSAWVLVLTGLLYVAYIFWTGHLRRNLFPPRGQRSWPAIRNVLAQYFRRTPPKDSSTYNTVQRLAYLSVIFILFPLVIITGLALSPAFNSAVPIAVNALGGRQSARTLHFFVSDAILLFVIVHVVMVSFSGLRSRTRAMITGREAASKEPA